MTHVTKDIERPLGQAVGTSDRRRGWVPPVRSLVGGLCAFSILAVSTAIALREPPFRNPAMSVTSTPLVTEAKPAPPTEPAAETAAAKPPAQSPAGNRDGPSIIHVDPEDAGRGNGVIIIRDPSAVGQNLSVAHLPDRALIEESDEGSGSAAYVPPDPKDDVQLAYALDLLRGVKTDPAFPPNPDKAVMNQ